MLNPVSLGCGHSSCNECIEELVKIKGPRSICPVCRTYVDRKSVKKNITLQQITRALPVKCCNKDCEWEGIYQNAAAHYGQCPKLDIECPNDGCFRTEIRESMDAHTAVCPKRKVPCPECKRPVVWESLPDHQTADCPNAIMECPLSCGESFPRSNIILHVNICDEKAVKCKVEGCGRIIKRREINQHIAEAATSHYRLQAGEIQRLRQLIHAKKCDKELVELKEERVVAFRWQINIS